MSANVSSTANSEKQLTPKQEQLITLLVAGVAIVTAALNVGIAEKTAHRWLKLPHFQEALKAARKEANDLLWEELRHQLLDTLPLAISILQKHGNAEVEPTASTQIRAAQLLIHFAVEQDKMIELEAKFAELEQLVKGGLARGNH